MAWLLFIDESGHDRRLAPYEVLAGVAVQDWHVWNLIKELHAAEIRRFGRRYSAGTDELKGKKILKTKVFHHVALNTPVSDADIPILAKKALDDGANSSVREWKALALAKLAYVTDVFALCARFRCRVFASVVETDAPGTASDGLRKDYGYLFERFFYFLEDNKPREHGIIVFDELEKTRSHLLIDQCHRYFKDTAIGRHRASLIVPEPFFVHSDLTTGIQLADLAAYVISWGFRTPAMQKPSRKELAPYAKQIAELRYRASRKRDGEDFDIWSIAHISDLRTSLERDVSER
jgi:Protein of unknown function (DUF3800)